MSEPKKTDPPAPAPAQPDPPPAPTFASAEEFRTFQAQVSGRLDEMSSAFTRAVGMLERTGSVARPAPAPAIEDVADEDLERALASGEGGSKLIRKLVGAAVEKVRREEVAPLRTNGLGAIAKLTKVMATQRMKFYDRYKKEIDAAIETLAPEARLDPEILIGIHNLIAGKPENIEAMIREEREKALRDASDGGEGGNVPGARRTDSGSRAAPVSSPRELLGDDAADALEAASRSPDRFAQGLGYRDWPHYVEDYKKGLDEGAKGGNA